MVSCKFSIARPPAELLRPAFAGCGVRRGIDDLAHALVIEENGYATRREKNGCSFLKRRRVWAINLVAVAGDQRNRERLEGLARHQHAKGFVEVLYGHGFSFPAPARPTRSCRKMNETNTHVNSG